ncbi:hypothetical protein [Pontibacillus salipaludis]|uniref:Uncharacterized protein n=1 Tax=Pontibacillus salipaludis TaxID=1697394 RepID=A0ABQ1QJT0_9BACI|nr:hypothetical protein [Pontibacillus salipaludis]GGD29522.1 hypothetical protein GCM10011389_41340 [Pontibacillus salipaludis]
MSEMKNFMYELNQFMKWSEEMKDAYERLSEEEQLLVNKHTPFTETPRQLNKEVTKWYESMHEKVTY